MKGNEGQENTVKKSHCNAAVKSTKMVFDMKNRTKSAIILNNHLYRQTDHRFDRLFVTTRPPCQQAARTVLDIHLEDRAAVLDSAAEKFPHQPAVGEIRSGSGDFWLLSGGSLIFDQKGDLAVGLRDGNAADAFLWTNIGAGRCDRKLLDHCLEEMATEFILCARDPQNVWHQVCLGPQTTPVRSLKVTAVDKKIKLLLNKMGPVTGILTIPYTDGPVAACPETRLTVRWKNGTLTVHEEKLEGFCLIDHKNKTIEFRLTARVDLSRFQETVLFFGEGTGYGEWMSPTALKKLIMAEPVAGRVFVTPVLRALGQNFSAKERPIHVEP